MKKMPKALQEEVDWYRSRLAETKYCKKMRHEMTDMDLIAGVLAWAPVAKVTNKAKLYNFAKRFMPYAETGDYRVALTAIGASDNKQQSSLLETFVKSPVIDLKKIETAVDFMSRDFLPGARWPQLLVLMLTHPMAVPSTLTLAAGLLTQCKLETSDKTAEVIKKIACELIQHPVAKDIMPYIRIGLKAKEQILLRVARDKESEPEALQLVLKEANFRAIDLAENPPKKYFLYPVNKRARILLAIAAHSKSTPEIFRQVIDATRNLGGEGNVDDSQRSYILFAVAKNQRADFSVLDKLSSPEEKHMECCTPDHRWPLRNLIMKRAKNLLGQAKLEANLDRFYPPVNPADVRP